MMRRLFTDIRLQAALILAVCALVYWPMLGRSGFSSTEGHRVIPGWEMLDRAGSSGRDGEIDRWLAPRMFGQVYLRKPPGMPWAVAASAAVLGESEWSARAVSALAATLGALVSFIFATRWFGAPFGLAAGMVYALTPWFWSSGRSAEIEALNNFAVHSAALLMLDLLLGPRARSAWGAGVRPALAAAAIVIAGLAKGPAGAPVLGAVILAALIVKRSWRPALNPALIAALLVSGAALAGLAMAISGAAARAGQSVVTQGVSDFLWEPSRILGVLTLPVAALAAGLPGSLGLLFAWSPAGRIALSTRQRAAEPVEDGPSFMARGLAWSCLLSLVILLIAGVSNPRYTMPAMGLPAVLTAHAASVAASGREAKGTRVWRLLTLSHPAIVPVILVIAAIVYIPVSEAQRERSSGRAAGHAIGGLLPDGATVWADHVVEARPEVLLYAQRRARELGRTVEVRWKPASPAAPNPLPPPGQFLLLRGDEASGEAARYAAAGIALRRVWTGRVHKFDCVLSQLSAE
ncbi:MAG: glycosyltransferase family 39 protein [Phycisphaerales bacterium]|nr:glycosyltransferase family 39 protein [Phycisphaerales bacterium]